MDVEAALLETGLAEPEKKTIEMSSQKKNSNAIDPPSGIYVGSKKND